MDVQRALEIYQDKKNTFAVKLDGQHVWIEKINEIHGMATVQIGTSTANMRTVNVGYLEEG